MTIARLQFIFVLLAVFISAGGIFVQPVQAEEACACYCAIDNHGAQYIGDYSLAGCNQTCEEGGVTTATCATTASQLPSQNMLCFTSEQCAAQGGEFDSFQPGECPVGSHYCFAGDAQDEVALSVSIEGLESTNDFGDYVAAIYTWMLGVSITIAVVMVMIGGLQYTFSAGGGEAGKAKKRIRDAVMGVILLLFSYAILSTVNPALVKLQVPDFPMIRTVVVEDESSCGYLTGEWGMFPYEQTSGAPSNSIYTDETLRLSGLVPYVVENQTHGEICGSVGEIITGPDGEAYLPKGSTCSYNYCPKYKEGEICLGTGESAECLKCTDLISFGPLSGNYSPSSANCSALEPPTVYNKTGDSTSGIKEANYCFYTRDTSGVFFSTYVGTCASLSIDCNAITSCGSYWKQTVIADDGANVLGAYDPAFFDGDENFQTICQSDPCGIGQKTNSTCTYRSVSLAADRCLSVQN
jgi:hypothetical protein